MNKNEEREGNCYSWPVIIKNPNARASLDYYYGPYASEEEMDASVPAGLKVPGFTAAVQSEGGEVEEFWWQGDPGKWERKHPAVELPDGSMRFMGYAGSYDDLLAKESPSKGDVWQVSAKNGRGTIFPLYVWSGSSWARLWQNYSLAVKMPDGTSKTYTGLNRVDVDLSGVATRQDVADAKAEMGRTYATIESLDGLATWEDGGVTLLGKRLDDHSVKFRTTSGDWADTGVKLNPNTNITLSKGAARVRVDGGDMGLARNGNPFYYRANPLVLAVRVTDLEYKYNYTILQFYNPFNLDLSIERQTEGVFTFTHNLTNAGVSGILYGGGIVSDKTETADSKVTYLVVGDANLGRFNDREHAYFSVLQRRFNSFDFRTASGKCHDFNTLDLFIFDFNVLQ